MNKKYEHEGIPLNKPIIRDILTNKQPPPREFLSIDIVPAVDVPADVPLETFLKNEFPDMCDTGIPINIDVSTLIDEVIISPYAESWVTETVQSVIDKYGFNFKVNPSTLLDKPVLDEFDSDSQQIQD